MGTDPAAVEQREEGGAGAEGNGKPLGVWGRLLEAQRALEAGVSKGGHNKHHDYDYVRAEDVIRECGKALHAAGLVATVRIDETDFEPGQTSGGARSIFATVKGGLVLTDPETLERAEFPLIGQGTDTPGDKALYKAMSGGIKYAYLSALQVPFGDDPEDDNTPGGTADYRARNGHASAPPHGAEATSNDVDVARKAIGNRLDVGPDAPGVTSVLEYLEGKFGYLSVPALEGAYAVCVALWRASDDSGPLPDEPGPDDDGSAEDPDAADPTPDPPSPHEPLEEPETVHGEIVGGDDSSIDF